MCVTGTQLKPRGLKRHFRILGASWLQSVSVRIAVLETVRLRACPTKGEECGVADS
jgi:hypothetical protein